jgi:drug/metabolite transporter superfamily protein YnfA
MKSYIKNKFIRFLEVALALHGFLHFFEFGIAIYEEAYITATFAAFGGIIMLLSVFFLEGHSHHHNHKINNKHNHDKSDK